MGIRGEEGKKRGQPGPKEMREDRKITHAERQRERQTDRERDRETERETERDEERQEDNGRVFRFPDRFAVVSSLSQFFSWKSAWPNRNRKYPT